MTTMAILLGYLGLCISFVEFMVQFVKEFLPRKMTENLENVWAFAFSILSLFLPKLVKIPDGLIPTDFISAYQMIVSMHWTFCLLLGIFISRGSEAFYAFLKARGISTSTTKPGVVNQILYSQSSTESK